MAGILAYAREFRRGEPYGGGATGVHYEVKRIDGDFESVSNATWEQMRRYCEERGIPREAWPHYRTSIDMDLEELARQNEEIKGLLHKLPPADVRKNETLTLICSLIREGKQFYFAETV